MTLKEISLKQALNKAYRLIKPKRLEMEAFKTNLITLLGQIDEKESEENVKFHLMQFLRDTFYNPAHLLATKGRTDFVVHTGKEASTPAGVLFEVKRPLNTVDMVNKANLNTKAMHELVLYYLRERIEHKNNDIRQLVITNIYEWYIFDAPIFERLFYKNTVLTKQYSEWAAKQKVSSSTDLFYNEIAKPFLASLSEEVPFTWFDIRSYEKPLKNDLKEDDNKLIALFKVLSPTHLLKLPFANDSNSLDKGFYAELLHLIGLEEVKDGSKKIIRRKQAGSRNDGSILENTITILETENCLHKVPDLKSYGEEKEEQLFSVGLELCITWINRILFLKLLEAQLIKYHKGNRQYRFLNFETLPQYDELYKLFFQVLAKRYGERSEKVQAKFSHIPYLNSSLFEFSDMEDATIKINMLDDSAELPLLASTVLRTNKNKSNTGKLNSLQYLLEFLDAYDFASEGSEEIQEESKTLINASVLGLIFEKINGYKDGSIFTPGFITMYMCRQSIRQAVVNKFKDIYHWKAEAFDDLKNYMADDRSTKKLKEYNEQINSLTICDPAVGSGHFLVSALNELISIKADLGILITEQGQRLTDIEITLDNDELIVTDAQGDIFQYIIEPNKTNQYYIQPWKQDVQKTLFHEKQTIIENCLFGVDINPKSVQICRLRLWIELLKNAYYIIPEGQTQNAGSIGNELQTLPNIDINIKCGNSLISRFSITEDLKSVTPYFEKKILEYKSWVADYKHEVDKDKKRGIQQLMTDLKKGFLSKITDRNPTKIKLTKLTDEFLKKYVNEKLFSQNLTAAQKKDKQRLDKEIEKLNKELEAYVKNPVFSNSFEWRFEFPEVLNDKGDFIGFDIVIGNPPYFSLSKDPSLKAIQKFYKTFDNTGDIYCLFYEKGFQLLKNDGLLFYITSNKWMRANYGNKLRNYLLEYTNPLFLFDFNWYQVFDSASVDSNLLMISKSENQNKVLASVAGKDFFIENLSTYIEETKNISSFQSNNYWSIKDLKYSDLKNKLSSLGKQLSKWRIKINYGIKTGLNDAFIINEKKKNELILKDKRNSEIIKPLIRGRDVERFGYKFQELYLINAHNGVKESGTSPIDLQIDYPEIYSYLLPFKEKAEMRADKGDNWYNLRNCAYLYEFEKEKLIWAETMRVHKTGDRSFPRFGFDNSGSFTDKTVFIGVGSHIKYLLGFLNSAIGKWLIMEYVTKLDTGGYMMQKIFLDKIPILVPDKKQEREITDLVDKILENSSKNIDTGSYEKKIDELLFNYYDLNKEEVELIKIAG